MHEHKRNSINTRSVSEHAQKVKRHTVSIEGADISPVVLLDQVYHYLCLKLVRGHHAQEVHIVILGTKVFRGGAVPNLGYIEQL